MINFIGDILGTTGFARHTRELFNALYELNNNIYLSSTLTYNWQSLVNDAEYNALTNKHYDNGTTICIRNPPQWPFEYTDPCKSFYGYIVWEGTKIPRYWKKYIENDFVDGIIVPSEHVKEAIINTFNCSKPIHVIPHGVNFRNFYKEEIKKDNNKFRFICNKGWNLTKNDRGGIPLLLEAFSEEFKKNENVELNLKLNPAYINGNLDEAMNNLKLPKNRPKINICFDDLNDDGLRNFYNNGDCFVSTSYGEGFNLPILEAFACGVPAIIPRFGGQLDFCNFKNSYIINDGEFITPDDLIYENAKWFKLDKKALKKQLRYVFEHRDELKALGIYAEKTASEYTWINSAKELLKILKL